MCQVARFGSHPASPGSPLSPTGRVYPTPPRQPRPARQPENAPKRLFFRPILSSFGHSDSIQYRLYVFVHYADKKQSRPIRSGTRRHGIRLFRRKLAIFSGHGIRVFVRDTGLRCEYNILSIFITKQIFT